MEHRRFNWTGVRGRALAPGGPSAATADDGGADRDDTDAAADLDAAFLPPELLGADIDEVSSDDGGEGGARRGDDGEDAGAMSRGSDSDPSADNMRKASRRALLAQLKENQEQLRDEVRATDATRARALSVGGGGEGAAATTYTRGSA